jgi:pre-mRNA-splicing factor 18
LEVTRLCVRPGAPAAAAAAADSRKKFVKRGDIEKVKEAEREKEEQERLQKKRKFEERNEDRGSREVTPKPAEAEEIKFVPMPREDVIRRLRVLNQPVTYFGETDEERQRRLHQIELVVSERISGAAGGQNNTFHRIMQDSVEAEIAQAMAAGNRHQDDSDAEESGDEATGMRSAAGAAGDEKDIDEATAAASIRQLNASSSSSQMNPKNDLKKSKEDFPNVEEFILHFLKRVLKEWEDELELRSNADKQSAHGKYAKATWHQTRSYLKPLFKMLKRQNCEKDVLKFLEKVHQLISPRFLLQPR